MSQAKHGDTVVVRYTGRLDDGTTVLSSEHRAPPTFTLGRGDVPEGLEHAVEGMAPGESKKARVEAAFGPRREELVFTVGREVFPEGFTPEVGLQLNLRQPPDRVLTVEVTRTSEEEVTLDANHPLAGQAVTFVIQLQEICP
jgi:peptidylprolyl isomerase